MIHITKETTHSGNEVVKLDSDFFGTEGLGLEEKDRNSCCITFEGGGGYVSVTVVEAGDKRDVDVESREWEYEVKKFLETI
ncbi:MAG: hypothetical protein JSW12_04985 [Deltaproteobacteria bacterium]|nr:MAG: hypothetical protein JSW12_04985 [Deltaproteobacteria bacterium]